MADPQDQSDNPYLKVADEFLADSRGEVLSAADIEPEVVQPDPGIVLDPITIDIRPDVEQDADAYAILKATDLYYAQGEKYAGMLALQERTGLSREAVEAKFPELQQSVKAAGRDPGKWRRENPSLFQWANEDHRVAPLVGDETTGIAIKAMRAYLAHERMVALYPHVKASDLFTLGMAGTVENVFKQVLRIKSTGDFFETEEQGAARKELLEAKREAAAKDVRGAFESRQVPIEDATDIEVSGGLERAASVVWGKKAGGIFAQNVAIGWDHFSRTRKHLEAGHHGTFQMFLDSEVRHRDWLGDPVGLETARAAAYMNQSTINDLLRDAGVQRDYGVDTELGRLGLDIVEGFGSQVESIGAMVAGLVIGAPTGAALGSTAGGIGAAPGAIVGAGIAIKTLAFASSYSVEAGGAYNDFKVAKDDQGNVIDPDIAMAAASIYGMMAAGVEVVALGPQLKAFGPLGKAIAQGSGRAWMRRAMVSKSTMGLLKGIGRDLAKSAAAEGAEEMVQETLQTLSKWGAKTVSSGELQHLDVEQLKEDALTAGYKGMVGGLFGLGGVQATAQLFQAGMSHSAAAKGGSQVAAITGMAKGKIAPQAPKQIARLIEIETERAGQPVTHLYLNPAKMMEIIEEQGAEAEESVKLLLGEDGVERMRFALLEHDDESGMGNTLEVTVEEYLERIGGTEIGETLAQDTVVRQGHLTTRELGEIPNEIAKLTREFEAGMGEAEGVEISGKERELADLLVDQMVQTRRLTREEAVKSVAPTLAFVRTMMKRSPAAAEQVFAGITMEVRSALAGVLDAPAASKQLSKQLEAMDNKDRARVMWIDGNTELLNERAIQALPADPTRPLLVRVKLEGTKWVNNVGHTPGNQLYRLGGQALSKLTDTATKWGGDFAFMAGSIGEAQAIATKLQDGIRDDLRGLNQESAAEIEGLGVIIGVEPRGSDLASAWKKLGKSTSLEAEQLEAAGQRAQRGQRPLGLPMESAADLALPQDPAQRREAPDVLAEQVAKMTEAEIFNAAYRDPATGMLTREGFFSLPAKKHVVSLDLNGLKAINLKISEEFGDTVLAAFAEAANLIGAPALDMAHLSGDEFALQTDDLDTAQFFIDTLSEILQHSEVGKGIEVQTDDGRWIHGITYGYGIGENYDAADAKVTAHKDRERTDPGAEALDRAARTQGRLERKGPDQVGADQRRRGVAEGRAALARGTQEQMPVGVRPGVRGSLRQARTAAAAQQLRYKALRGDDPARVALELLNLDSLESEAAAAIAVELLSPPSAETATGFRSKGQAWSAISDASWPDGSSPTQIADSNYSLALDGKGKMPGPYADRGLFGDVDSYLDLTGRQRVKGGRHAFDLLFSAAKGTKAERAEEAVGVLRGVTGFEDLRLDDDTAATLAGKQLELEVAERETAELDEKGRAIEEAAIQEELDISFNVDEFGEWYPTPLEQPSETDIPRGFISTIRDGAAKAFRIFLTSESDLSTMLHEQAHSYMEMFADIAEHPDADQRVRDDYAALLSHYGVATRAELTRKEKEAFATDFEAYFRQGKAPSPKLAEAFASFRLWLNRIYKTALGINVEIAPEIRVLFDRMLATDSEIAQQEAAAGLDAPFVDGVIDPADLRDHLRSRAKLSSKLALTTRRKQYEAEVRAVKAFKTAEFKRLKAAAKREWDRRQDVRAMNFAAKGWVPREDHTIDKSQRARGKLDRRAVVKELGEDHPLVKSLGKRLVDEGGLHPQLVGESFGFLTSRGMLDAMAQLPDEETSIQAKAEEQMREEHPEIDGEIAKLGEYIQTVIHEENTGKWLQKEYAKIRRKAAPDGSPAAEFADEIAKRAAKDIVNRRKIGRLDVGSTLNRERSAAEMATVEAAKGNFRRARELKRLQMLEHHVWRELDAAKNDREKFKKTAKQLAQKPSRQRLGKAHASYRDVIDTLLESLQMTRPRPLEDVARLGLDDVVAAMTADGDSVAFDTNLIGRLLLDPDPRSWQELTVEEMRGVHDALKNISKAASNRNQVLMDGKRYDRDTVVDDLALEADVHLPDLGPKASDAASGLVKRALDFGQMFDAYLLRIPTMIDWLGGDNIGSTWFRAIIKPLREAAHTESDLMEKTIKPIMDAMEAIPKNVLDTWNDIIDGERLFPGHRAELVPARRFEILLMLLNTGNESNIHRLTEGRGITMKQIEDATAELGITKAELEWIQSVWDASESLWPLARELEERDTGVAPEKLTLRPFTVQTPEGPVKMKGGYFPAIYDRDVTTAGKRQEIKTAADLLPNVTRPSTGRGHLKGRVENFSDAIDLTPRGIQAGIFRTAHDIAFREPLRSVANLILDPRVQNILLRRIGIERRAVFTQWLQDVGRLDAARSDPHAPKLMRAAQALKSNLTVSILGHAIDNFMADTVSVLTPTIASNLTARNLAGGLNEFNLHPKRTLAFAREHSGAIRQRDVRIANEFRQAVNNIGKSRWMPLRAWRWYRDNGWAVAQMVDRGVSTAIWMGAYRQYANANETHADAVTFADDVVSKTMPATSVVDLAAIQRDRGMFGSLSLFYGYYSLLYQQERRLAHRVYSAKQRGESRPGAFVKSLGNHLALIVITRLLAGAIMGKGPEPEDGDDEGERWMNWALRGMLIATVDPLPFGVGRGIEQRVLGRRAGGRPIPMSAFAEVMERALGQAFDALGDDADPQKALITAVRATGMLSGTPTRPLRGVKYLLDLANPESDVEARGPFDVAAGILYGENEFTPQNIPRLMQDVISD